MTSPGPATGLVPRSWGAGMPEPYEISWLHKFGVAIVFFFPSVAAVIVGFRLYGRVRLRQIGWDDALIVIATALSIAFSGGMYMYMLTNYSGIHSWDVPPHDSQPGRLWDFIIQVIYNPVLALVKSSVLLFLLRLGGTRTSVRWAIHTLNAVNIGLMIAVFFVVIFACQPVRFYWDKTVEGTCLESDPFNIGTAIITICTDVLVLAIPVWILMDLKMALRVKLLLLGVFLLGFIVTIVGAIRLWLLTRFLRSRAEGFPDPDPNFTLGFTSSCIEGNLAIITASIPALWPLARLWFPEVFSRFGISHRAGTWSSGGSRSTGSSSRGSKKRSNHKTGSQRRVVTIGGTSQHYGSDGSSFVLKPVRGIGHTEIRSHTPEGSEEEIAAYNGIMTTKAVQVKYDEGPLSRYVEEQEMDVEPPPEKVRSWGRRNS